MGDWALRPNFEPGTDRGNQCSICHSDTRTNARGEREQVVSTGELIEMEGLFSICETCMVEGALLLGMIPAPRATALATKNRDLGRENAILKARLSALEKAAETLRELA